MKTLKNDFGLSEVIKMTDMNFQRARTRWRMHRSPIASHQHRMNMVDSPTCRQCRTTPRSNETDQHALLECSKHRRIRSDMLNALQARIPDITLSIPLLLGHKDTIEKYAGSSRKAKKFLYNSTGQFITLLCENRVEHVTCNEVGPSSTVVQTNFPFHVFSRSHFSSYSTQQCTIAIQHTLFSSYS